MTELLDRRLGQYHLTEITGRGGMSTVYKAYQAALDRYVAVKVLVSNRDPQFAARFRREAHAMASLQHHNILPIYDYDEQGGLRYLVLQYVEKGITLGDMLGKPMAAPTALRLTAHVLDALDYAHKRGVIHRDIKPSNVLMPSPNWPMLTDFGIAKLMNDNQPHLTLANQRVGTAAYMAPEQATGQPIDARTDLYAAGVVLYELVTGRVPFDADTPITMMTKHVYEAPPQPRSLNPDLSVQVEQVLERALAKDPNARYQSAAEMAEDLNRVAAQLDQNPVRSRTTGLYEVGMQALQQGNWKLAMEQFVQVMKLDPDYEDVTQLLTAAREAQERSIAIGGQQIESMREQRQSEARPQLRTPTESAPAKPKPPPTESTTTPQPFTGRATIKLPTFDEASLKQSPPETAGKPVAPPSGAGVASPPISRPPSTLQLEATDPPAARPPTLGESPAATTELSSSTTATPASAAGTAQQLESATAGQRRPLPWIIAAIVIVALLVALLLVMRPWPGAGTGPSGQGYHVESVSGKGRSGCGQLSS